MLAHLLEHWRSWAPFRGSRSSSVRLERGTPAPPPRSSSRGPSSDRRRAAHPEELALLRESLDDYEVLGRIESGGQGVVYEARQRRANRMVAIKLLLDGPLATDRQRYRFEQEIQVTSRLQHPNIVTLFDSGFVRGRPYYTMQFVEGEAIDAFVLLRDLAPRAIVTLMIKVARAVQYAHQNGVIHRDLKPENVLVDEAGEPHIFDFGLAKDTLLSDGVPGWSMTGQVIGTLPYLSPEQAGGFDGRVDVRTDVYALSLLLYQLLTDAFPYPVHGSAEETRTAIIARDPQRLSEAVDRGGRGEARTEINRDLEAIVSQGLAKRKEERYQSVADFVDDLERYLAHDAVKARAPTLGYRLAKTIRRHRALASGVAAVTLITLVSAASVIRASWQVRAERDRVLDMTSFAVNSWSMLVNDVERVLRPLPGGRAPSDELLRRAEVDFQRLLDLTPDDPSYYGFSAILLRKKGDIARELGEPRDAERFYEALLAAAEKRAADTPDDPSVQCDIAFALRRLAESADNPLPLLDRAIVLADSAFQCDPTDATALEYACCLTDAADQQVTLAEYDRAATTADTADQLITSRRSGRQNDRQWSELAAEIAATRAAVLHSRGDTLAGLPEAKRAMVIRREIADGNPVDTEARHALLKSYCYLAFLQRGVGQTAPAAASLDLAIAEGDALAAMDPGVVTWNTTRGWAHRSRAEIALDAGRSADARPHCESAARLADAMVGALIDPTAARQAQADSMILLGRLALAEENPASALFLFERAIATYADQQSIEPGNLAIAVRVAKAQYWLGLATYRGCDPAASIHVFEQSARTNWNLLEARPRIARFLLEWSRARGMAVAAMIRLRDPAIDEEALQITRAILSALDNAVREGWLSAKDAEFQGQLEIIQRNERILIDRQVAVAGS